MIATNVHLFIDYRQKIKLTFESTQYATAHRHDLMDVKHNASFYYLFIYWHGILIEFIAPLLLCVVQDSSQHKFYCDTG